LPSPQPLSKWQLKLVIENNRECYHCSGSHPLAVPHVLGQSEDRRHGRTGFGFTRDSGALATL